MKKERFLLSLIAIAIGLAVSGGAFYLYQARKALPSGNVKKISVSTPTPSPLPSITLSLNSPKDEEVVASKTVKVSGKTMENAKVLILTQTTEESAVSAKDGSFSTNITIEEGQNVLEVTVFAPNGEKAQARRVVTYSTEEF